MKGKLGLLFLFFVVACNHSNVPEQLQAKSGEVKYARGFSIHNSENYTEVNVFNPWDNYSLLASYTLTDSNLKLAATGTELLRVPVRKGVFLSSTYLGMIATLEAQEIVCASTSANWVYDSLLYANYREGKITDLGNDLTVDPEAIIAQSPEIVMKYIYQTADPVDNVIKNAGIPVVYNIEFMEMHPLGRAEWIKFVGLLTGKKLLADSIFKTIESNYFYYTNLAKSSKNKPTVLVGNSYKGTWFAVGGKSFIAQLLTDANVEYYWSDNSSTGALPLSFEAVLQKQKEADFWLNANAASLAEIITIEPRCAMFNSFQSGKVYHYNKRVNPEGGLDYYESGVVRPDILLKDLILIFHPELFTTPVETTYWKKLN